ncbi:variable surface family protein [Natrinema salaciae]|uniref:CR-type domain-containing protein n=1 Tax=Natrinema salaciae TaxID=1186196 RepID=A0A1H8ZKN1_9EURY|nr:hypothetical protein [Natrinema salaciae]SEP65012.1 hypothetical protein SAMN04489841_0199 [Natrinema salaciae]
MSSQLNGDLLLGQSRNELFETHSSPTEILARLEAERSEELPDNFLEEATPREPNDILVLRGTAAEGFNRRSWKEEDELRDEDFHREEFIDPPAGTVSTGEFEDCLGKEFRSILAHDYGTCSECDGTPEWDCERCEGDAVIECDSCGGAGSKSCPDCRGAGEFTCSECEGQQDVSCDTCDGDGELTIEDDCPNCTDGVIRVKETCSQCQGEGKLMRGDERVSCSRCSGGWFSSGGVVAVKNTCPECRGRGATRRRTTCHDCGGSQRQACGECSGTGSLPCETCAKVGHVACKSCDGSGERSCPDCPDGTVTCSVCEGDRETHSIAVRRTTIRPDTADVTVGQLPHGITNPDWVRSEPVYLEVETRAGTTAAREATEIDIDRVGDGTYVRSELRYVAIRELTYDYGEQNFRVRELNDEIHYTRYPEPEAPGLIDRVRNLF